LLVVILNRFLNWPDGVDRTFPNVTLKRNTWDDYGFRTTFEATLWIEEDYSIDLGEVKIGREGMKSTTSPVRVEIPEPFSELPPEFFSLGQDRSYYRALEPLSAALQADFANSMRDIPMLGLDRERLEREDVYRISLLRFSTAMAALDAAAERFATVVEARVNRFRFETTLDGARGPHVIPFDFEADAGVPHRINVLVGANGVGKTQVMARLAALLSGFEDSETVKERKASGQTFEVLGSLTPRPSVYAVLAVSFSAFDDFDIPNASESQNFEYSYCGLRLPEGGIADKAALAKRIASAVRSMNDEQKGVLRHVIDAVLPELAEIAVESNKLYNRLSAGQRIVLNIICDVIRRIRERSLVLLDEPETHLHPQLLATFISVLGMILEKYDSFAVIATHSPLAVQQIVAKRVHVIRRMAERLPLVASPSIETFGASLTDITREVFDAIESDRDYRDALDQLLELHGGDAEAVKALFPKGLGLSAEIYLESQASQSPTPRADF